VASALVKSTVPKSANSTRAPLSSKSSTIHSAFASQRAYEEVISCVTVWPVVRFSITAVPEVVEEAVTVSLMTLPAAMGMPEKS
jgi:hypothetical protein